MGFYNTHVLPRLIDLSMTNRELRPFRERVVSQASGRVVEIGIGSGMNLPLYSANVLEIVGVEPSRQLLAIAEREAGGVTTPTRFINASAEQVPIESASIDTGRNDLDAVFDRRRAARTEGDAAYLEE
jgi:ubiquinone/menaquinone biosynthesis C-methylase UbiE